MKLNGTPCDAYTIRIESHYVTGLDMYASNAKKVVAV